MTTAQFNARTASRPQANAYISTHPSLQAAAKHAKTINHGLPIVYVQAAEWASGQCYEYRTPTERLRSRPKGRFVKIMFIGGSEPWAVSVDHNK